MKLLFKCLSVIIVIASAAYIAVAVFKPQLLTGQSDSEYEKRLSDREHIQAKYFNSFLPKDTLKTAPHEPFYNEK